MIQVYDDASEAEDRERAAARPEELGGEPPCWAHLLEPDEDPSSVVADLDGAGEADPR